MRVEVPVRLPHGSGTVTLEGGELTLDGQVVAIRDGGPCTLVAGKPRQLAFRLQLGGLAVGESRLAIHFMGRPARGPRSEPEPLRVADGPRVQLERPSPPREGEPPWVVIDLGTHSTAVAAAWRSEESEHVRLVSMGPGDVLPSRVAFAATASGDHELASIWSHDIESTHRIELGPQFGDGPHPDSPVHVAASEVGRFFVKALLLEIRERAAWLPLSRCQFLVAVSPRLTSTPRLARSVEQVFTDSIREVWGPDAAQRLYFREEPLLAATPRVLADLAARPLAARERRGYWVVDFGAGTTDACGVEVHADDDGGASIGPLHVAEGGPREVGGRDVSRAFYAVLVHALVQTGGDWDLPEDRFLPSQASAAARSNRRAVAALADAVKCAPLDRLDRTVGDVAGGLHDASLVDRWGGRFALLDVLNDAVPKLAASTVAALHQQVMQAQWAHGGGGTDLQPWLDHCRAAMERFAGHLGIGAGDVIVLPIGRAVRLPAVVQGLARVFGEQRVDPVPGTLVDRGTLDARVDPKTLVALGGGLLALQAAGGRLRAPVLPVRARAG